jgi:hypothetical protein
MVAPAIRVDARRFATPGADARSLRVGVARPTNLRQRADVSDLSLETPHAVLWLR